jgi:hypothetical protein
MAYQGDNVDPNATSKPYVGKDINDENRKAQMLAIEKEKDKWIGFLKTPHGAVCLELAEPKIRYFDTMLGLDIHTLVSQYSLPLDILEQIRAEWRGERKVWSELLYRSEELGILREEIRKGEVVKEQTEASWWKKIIDKILQGLVGSKI